MAMWPGEARELRSSKTWQTRPMPVHRVMRAPSDMAMPGALLAAVLQRVEAEEGQPRDAAIGSSDGA